MLFCNTAEPNSIEESQMDLVGGASDLSFVEAVESMDETGYRSRGRDLNSGPEKGKNSHLPNYNFYTP